MAKKFLYVVASALSLMAFLTIWGNLFYLLPSVIPSDRLVFLGLFAGLSLGLLFFGLRNVHAAHDDNRKNIAGIVLNGLIALSVILALTLGSGNAGFSTSDYVFSILYGVFHFLCMWTYVAATVIRSDGG